MMMLRNLTILLTTFVIMTTTTTLGQEHPPASICRLEGFFRYPNNCKRFYRCVDWSHDGTDQFSIFHFMCPDGTIFDERVQVRLFIFTLLAARCTCSARAALITTSQWFDLVVSNLTSNFYFLFFRLIC
jgi:hypothetical protein